MAKRIYYSVLEAKAPHRIREIEMAVDKAVLNPGISIQFWQDVRTFGLREACLYLQGYARDGLLAIKEEADNVMELCTIVIEQMDSPRPLPLNSQNEGNGFDDI